MLTGRVCRSLLGALVLWCVSLSGFAQSCGSTYDIRPRDTLSGIAKVVYQSADRWLEIYEYRGNAATIGSNPNLLRPGMRIDLPVCDAQIDIAAVSEPPAASTEQPNHSDEPSGAPFLPPIEIVTGGDYSPFTDQTIPGGGMLTQIVSEAMLASDLPNEVSIDFINDWESHIKTLLPKGKYRFGFPWFRPDCDDLASLPDDMKSRCDYVWSAPLYTVSIAFYAPSNIENPPETFDQLIGTRICRPAGYFTFDLAEQGLFDGRNITLVHPETVAECFYELERGAVDFVSLNRFTAEKAIANADLVGLVSPIKTLVTVLDLHLIAHKDDVLASTRWLEAFNEGLLKIQENGLFGQIVSYHLQKHRQEIAQLAQR